MQDLKQKILENLKTKGYHEYQLKELNPIIQATIEATKQALKAGVSNWVAIESEEQPERVTDVMVKYKDNRKEVAFFDGDGRFYTQNGDDITDKIASWDKLP